MLKIVNNDPQACAMELARINQGWKRVRNQYVEMAETWCSLQDRLELDSTGLSFDNASLTLNGTVLGKPFRVRVEPTTLSGSAFGRCFIEGGHPDEPKPLGTFVLDRNGHAYNEEAERIVDVDTYSSPHWVLLCNVLLAVIG